MAPVLVTRHPQKVFITAILQPLLLSTHSHSVNSGWGFNGAKIALHLAKKQECAAVEGLSIDLG